jgi:outer membrane biosynthesis protein TonB
MAFEAFLTQGKTRPRKARWFTGTFSLIIHGALLVGAIVYSYWNVDELSPPTVTVTFLTATPPPPPPPPARKKPKQEKVKPVPVVKEIVQPKANAILQPKEKEVPEEEPDEGVDYGVAGGTGPVPVEEPKEVIAPKIIPPAVGQNQLITDPVSDPSYRPKLPATLARAGAQLFILVKICVSKKGDVDKVSIIKSMDPTADPIILDKFRTYKFKPFTIDGRPVPFCFPFRYNVSFQQ